MPRKLTTEEFIEKARKVHGDKYGYDEVDYTGIENEVKIYCRSCQKYFYQTPHSHLKGHNCTNCGKGINKKLTTESFIEKAKAIHGNKFGYDEVEYKNTRTKVKIFCHSCQKYFWQLPSSHLQRIGCPFCKSITISKKNTLSKESFIQKAQKIHGNKYSYDACEYINAGTKIKIKCNICGNYFWQEPSSHLTGRGCPHCKVIKCPNWQKKSAEAFINNAMKIHGNKYSYDISGYTNMATKIKILCKKCGNYFWQEPSSHLTGRGCPHCRTSKLEYYTIDFLESKNISYIKEYSTRRIDKSYRNLRLDFYIPQLKVGIECQGAQHFKPVNFTGKMTSQQVQKNFEQQQLRDRLKKQYCEESGVKLYYIIKKEDLQDLYERRLIY